MSKLTELEGVVLGVVSRERSCTAYRVRQSLRDSPSTFWNASAGSVYPVLERLEASGLVVGEAGTTGARPRRLLAATRAGRAALVAWIRSGAEPGIASSVFDPIRSRAFFFGMLPARGRIRVMKNMLVELEAYLLVAREHLSAVEKTGGEFDVFGALGAVCEAEARVEWLREGIRMHGRRRSR